MRWIGIALAGLMGIAQPTLAQETPLTYEWASQASPSELRTRILGPLAPLYRDASRPEKHYAGGYLWKITFASTPRTTGLVPGVCTSMVMHVEFKPIVDQPFRRGGHRDVEVHLDDVRTSRLWVFMEGAPEFVPDPAFGAEASGEHVTFDKDTTNAMCAEQSNGWTFTSARDEFLFEAGIDLLKNVKDLAANNPAAIDALTSECAGIICFSLSTRLPTLSTDHLTGVSEADCEGLDGVHANRANRCVQLTFADADHFPSIMWVLGRRDDVSGWRALKVWSY